MDATSYKIGINFWHFIDSYVCEYELTTALTYITTSCIQICMHCMTQTKWVSYTSSLHVCMFPGTIIWLIAVKSFFCTVPCPILSSNCMSRPQIISDPINGRISGLICSTIVLFSTTPVTSQTCKKLILYLATIIKVPKRPSVLILTWQLSSTIIKIWKYYAWVAKW